MPNAPRLDGAASIGIGLVLLVSSLLLAQETKGLLIGEPARARVRDAILRLACEDPDVRTANGVLTVQMGVNQIIAALSVESHDTLNTTQIEMCVNRIETAIKQAQPDITILFVKPQSADTWRRLAGRVRLGRSMHEVTIETEAFHLRLIFADVRYHFEGNDERAVLGKKNYPLPTPVGDVTSDGGVR